MSKTFKIIFQHEASGGILLIAAALLALIMANSPLSDLYKAILSLPVQVHIGDFNIAKPLLLWINDGLMALFFFMVGLEIKRELMEGHLSSVDQVILPAIGAIAGIAAPALIYAWLNQGESTIVGWAIPSATDIAFALGVFSLFGKGLPLPLKLFLLSVAIFDDIGAIAIIAIFYSTDLSTLSLAVSGIGLSILFILNRIGFRHQAGYILVGVIVWAAVLKSGVHATLAGFAVAWFIPLKLNDANGDPMLKKMEHGLHPWVAFLILPVFAFGNSGVSFAGLTLDIITNPVTLGIMLGLFIGKQVGIMGACWIAVKAGITKLPAGATWMQMYGVSLLCGIGFTMSLFIGTLAFEQFDPSYQNYVKLGVMMGSVLSAILGSIVIAKSGPKNP